MGDDENFKTMIDLKKNIRKRGLTIVEVAKRSGMSQQSVSQAINGNPSLSMLQKIADAMEITVSELVKETEE